MSRDDLPVLTVDMDGVFCSPFFGWNAGVHRSFVDPALEPEPARIVPRWIGTPLDHLRFGPRRPIRGAREALARLREVRQLVVLTGRRTYPRWWMRHHGFAPLFDRVVVNETHLPSPHYKLDAIALLGAAEHVDDDPRTAQLLAHRSRARVFLQDWPTNRHVELDSRVERVRSLAELADRLGAPEVVAPRAGTGRGTLEG